MKNKYFTPDIEDICIGYEYEQLVTPLSESLGKGEEEWMKCKFPDPFTIDRILLLYERKKQLRVSYLTKEQIEDEGFIYRGKISHGTIPGEPFTKIELEFIKDNILIKFDVMCNKIMIDKADITEENVNFYNVKTLYHGECKDINTFRKIIKLLGI